ncbi:hypothetical protein JDW15_10385 [Aerococcaceae bacterium zg-ZJ1578]|uniref:hypothetical protein n=1 Tax=Aerococcaceae bacterium zg-252 TaxID=2796928 RepID=UPI001A33A9E5|nr:hypothetical protein [Aerococcaceae bacterium zg-1578]
MGIMAIINQYDKRNNTIYVLKAPVGGIKRKNNHDQNVNSLVKEILSRMKLFQQTDVKKSRTKERSSD